MSAPSWYTRCWSRPAPGGIGIFDLHPGHGQASAHGLAIARVIPGPVLDGEHAQASSPGKLAGIIGNVLVESARIVVLGFVHDTGGRIDGDGLVDEPTHAFQGLGRHAFLGIGRHFEAVPVLLVVTAQVL